ncbi:phage portal protein [Veronia pacifica]|uniref:Phage portal protein n=1 Tax=Veronia pacifica TaxID=1080227 RepID=A0A1C3EE47_9GAMM|nr:phage portal protein [Veronia pacifica]ODA31505.1 phage portal protein [Veronia pacifica]
MSKNIEVFSFGDPVPVLEGREITEYRECWLHGDYYEPPVSLQGLAKSLNASVHHHSALSVKRNILVSSYHTHPLLSKQDFSRVALDYLVFGNAYFERVITRLGKTIKLKPSPAKYTRRMPEDDYLFLTDKGHKHYFKHGTIFHLLEPDINQEIYGVPEYLAALNSAWLNESATLFRRKYYLNGSHAGFILYITDTVHEEQDINNLRKALKESKGPGNFRNLFMYAPDGKKDGLQVIPIADVSAKDEFYNIKNVTRDDVLAAHRVPPQIMGIIPQNTGGFGSAEAATKVFARNELMPLQERFRELNDWIGEEVINFTPYLVDIEEIDSTKEER